MNRKVVEARILAQCDNVCPGCQEQWEVVRDDDGRWWHPSRLNGEDDECEASALREVLRDLLSPRPA